MGTLCATRRPDTLAGVRSRYLLVAIVGVGLGALASCGEERGGQPCTVSTECPQVECEPGVRVQVCLDDRCVTDQADACELADGSGGGGGN